MKVCGLILASVLVAAPVAHTPIAAQTQATGSEASTPPRTPWGAPDLQGIWDFLTGTPLERPDALADQAFLTEEEAAEVLERIPEDRDAARRRQFGDIDVGAEAWSLPPTRLNDTRRTSLILDPPDGKLPPLTPAAQAREDARTRAQRPVRDRTRPDPATDGPEDLGLALRCILAFNAGPPYGGYGYNTHVQIFQTPDYVVLLNEMIHDARIVPLDGRPHLPEGMRQWLGDLRGHWDGDTLVVDSTNFTDKTASFTTQQGRALGTGATLHLIERFTRVDADTLHYEYTVDDVTTFTQPFTAAIPLKQIEGPIFEYACHEGNARTMEVILSAGRAAEDGEPAGDGVTKR